MWALTLLAVAFGDDHAIDMQVTMSVTSALEFISNPKGSLQGGQYGQAGYRIAVVLLIWNVFLGMKYALYLRPSSTRRRAFVLAFSALERGRRPPSNAARISPNGLRLFEFCSAGYSLSD